MESSHDGMLGEGEWTRISQHLVVFYRLVDQRTLGGGENEIWFERTQQRDLQRY